MSRPRKRIRRRRREHKTPYSFRLGVLITILVFVVVVAGFLMVPALNIVEVYCEGCYNTEPADIITTSEINTGGNILLAGVGKAKRQIAENPLIEDVQIRRVFPNKICISIVERTPAAYVMKGVECVAIDDAGVVLEIVNDERVYTIVNQNTPEDLSTKETTDTGNDEEGNSVDEDTQESESNKNVDIDEPENTGDEDTELIENIFPIPLITGVEVDDVKEGKSARSNDEDRFNCVIEICGALLDAELLNRTTYIDVTNTLDIRIVIENRLDVQIGGYDNIAYRMKFLSEVVNTKISAYEKAMLDYRGDDIYVRPPDDGEDRMLVEDEPDEESDSTEDSSDEEETDSESDSSDDEDVEE